MRVRRLVWSSAAATAALVTIAVRPARAERASCAEIAAARTAGASEIDIAAALHTTRARIAACTRLSEDRARLAAGRDDLGQQRAARAAR